MVKEAFERKVGFKLAVYEKDAKWVKSARKGTRVVGQEDLIKMMGYLADNTLINNGGVVYKQCMDPDGYGLWPLPS